MAKKVKYKFVKQNQKIGYRSGGTPVLIDNEKDLNNLPLNVLKNLENSGVIHIFEETTKD